MKLSEHDLFLLGQAAISAAYQAGHFIKSYTNKELEFEHKEAGNSRASQVVTEVDKKSQDIILNILQPTCDIYDLALLTEESIDDSSRLKKDYFWCIDPLDGTLPFIEKKNGYAVSIALVARNGIPVIGVVFDPLADKLYHAIKAKGCYINSKPFSLKPQTTNTPQKLTFAFDRSFVKKTYFNDLVESLKTEYPANKIHIIKHAGAVMNACWVLENSPAGYFKFPKKEKGGGSLWDYAATACLFAEAGAISTDIHGNEIELNRETSTFLNHRGIIYATDVKLHEIIRRLYLEYSE